MNTAVFRQLTETIIDSHPPQLNTYCEKIYTRIVKEYILNRLQRMAHGKVAAVYP